MQKITLNELMKLAHMAMLSISEHENVIPGLINRLETLIEYVSGLQELVKNHNEFVLPHNINILREDKVIVFDYKVILALAPEREENYFVVPMILKS